MLPASMDWRQSYQLHVIAVKQQDPYKLCVDGIEEVWLQLSECISGPVQTAGFFLVIASVALLVPARWSNYMTSADSKLSTYFRILWLSFLISALSLVGALLSMQIILLVAYDIAALLIDVVTALVAAIVRVCRYYLCDQDEHRYTRICDVQTQLAANHASTCKVLCFAALPLSILALMAASGVESSTEGKRDLDNFTVEKRSMKISLLHHLMAILGYAIGSAACFAQWAFQDKSAALIQANSTPAKEPSSKMTEVLVILRTVLILSDVLYVIGVLLQSGGWMIVLVTLPWTIRSSIRACAQCNDIYLIKFAPRDDEKNDYDDDSDVISFSESGSDTSNILWDQAWKRRDGNDRFTYYEKPRPKVFDNAVLRLMNQEVSTNSDWSSSSDEQELEWESETIAPYNRPLTETQAIIKQLHLASVQPTEPRTIPLTLTIPESYDQRVITWISNSTPEEENSPLLTTALDLDPSPQKLCDISVMDDPRAYPSAFLRKYSW